MYMNDLPYLHTPKSETRDYQMSVLEMLKDVDTVALESKTDYSLEAGSALGAARHEGFIPWDNDVDILMPLDQVKQFLIGMAKRGMFETYELWYYHSKFGWMYKDFVIAEILKDPENYCEISLDWAVAELTYAIFRIVRKETTNITMSLSKTPDSWPVGHFDPTLSTITLTKGHMLPEEERKWRRMYYKPSNIYQAHPFIDVFPTVELTPDEYLDMKRKIRRSKLLFRIGMFFANPTVRWPKTFRKMLPPNAEKIAKSMSPVSKFSDYRVGVKTDYRKGKARALEAKQAGDNLIISKTPWNLRKITPYLKSEIHPVSRTNFEGVELNAPAKMIQVLENHYKDFRKMPPENQRIQHAYHLDPKQFDQVVSIND